MVRGMSRPDTEGFSIMDVSTAILDDPKFLRLNLRHPELYADGVVGFVATLARSWRKGRRVTAQEAWPVYRPECPEALDALVSVALLDRNYRLPSIGWRSWFDIASERRDATRERNRKSAAAHRERQRTVSAESASGVVLPTVRPSVPAVPTVRARGGAMTSFAAEMEKNGLSRDVVRKSA
jgi:hypothetical protein